MEVQRFVILGEPCSGKNGRRNVKWGKRRANIKSEAALAWVEYARAQLSQMNLKMIEKGAVGMRIKMVYSSMRKDMDEQLLLDILQGFAYKNDRQICDRHTVRELDKKFPRAEVEVWEL